MKCTLGAIGGERASGARWTLGALLLGPLATANSSYTAVPAIITLAIFATFATFTCKDLKNLSVILPPAKTFKGRRERNLRSFADFMAIWMTFLSHLAALAIYARILSATADHVTEGKTRRWLFGYETRALGEPWPDALGVTVILVICALFMCGLEENVMFTVLLLFFLYIFSQIFAIFGIINMDFGSIRFPIPVTIYELVATGAPMSYIFNAATPNENGSLKRNMMLIYLPTIIFTGYCFLYANMLKDASVDAALPATTLLEARAEGWVRPILAGVTVLSCCLALTELCPILFTILVNLASPEWKVLTRSMTYESTATGSHVLAVFTAGSLAAILAFACPLSHMITLLNASHLLGITIQAFQFIIMRCLPTVEQKEAGNVEYKRLEVNETIEKRKLLGVNSRRSFWTMIRHTKTIESLKSKTVKEAEDRECLLLDEYSGGPNEEIYPSTSSSSARDLVEVVGGEASDAEVSEHEVSSGDDSTDIDAAVKEYRDTIQVVTAPPEANSPTLPCVNGARWSAAAAFLQTVASTLIAMAFFNESIRNYLFATGIPLWLCSALICVYQPAHKLGTRKCQSLEGPVTLLASILFLTPLLLDSWPAILLFAGAGVLIYVRCERWCGDLAMQHARNALIRHKLQEVKNIPMTSARLAHIDAVYITR